MGWLIPSIIATMSGTALLSFVYFYLYIHDRRKHLAVWSLSWAIYFLRYVFMLMIINGYGQPVFYICNQSTALLSGIVLLWGTYLFIEKTFPKAWVFSCAIGFCWIVISNWFKFPFFVMSTPTFMFLALVYAWTGVKFIKSDIPGAYGKQITGWTFVVWGIHKANYPFLRPVAWFAPWGYLIASVLEFLVALGMLLVYFHKIRSELKQEQLFLQKAQEIGKIGTWSLDIRKNELFWTDENYRIFGLPIETKLTYETFLNCVHPDDKAYVDREWKASFDNKLYDIEHRIVVNGEIKWVQEKAELEFDAQGECIKGIGVTHDITDRKRFEETIQTRERDLRSLINAISESVCLFEPDGKIVAANETFARRMNMRVRDLVGESLFEVISPDLAKARKQFVDKVMLNGRPVHYEDEREGRWYHHNVWPVLNANGSVARLVVYATDITDWKRAEEERMRLISAVEQTGEVIMITDHFGAIVYVNPAFEKVTGYTAEEAKGQNPKILKSGKHDGPFYRQLWETITAGGTWQGRMVNRRKDGSLYTEEATISPVFDNQGEITNFVAVKRDVTSELELENRLAQSQKMEAIGTLAGGIAHDFNNILSIIVGNTELAMVEVPEWSPAQDNLKEVREATLRARELVKQILLFARKKEHTISNIRLEPIAKESLRMLRASIPTTVEIRENIEENLPPVLADPSQIQQIIMNLCTNAGQVMEADGGHLTFRLDTVDTEMPLHTVLEELPAGRYVRMQVKDTGPGIPPENLEKIFDPFFTTKGVGEGTGLGLAVVQGIVQDRKGGITVESEEGRGTTFTIYLPASDVPAAEVTVEQKTELPSGTERILFVDDEPMILKLGQRMLERQGYEVVTRASGTDALECFKHDPERFDLIVTDMTMPGMRGDRLAEEIMEIRPDIPVVLSTGYSKQISNQKAREMGIRAFVMKPLTQHELANTVRKVLDENAQK